MSFLDAHIQCGDGLVGVMDLKALEDGIPDEAYKPLSGDEKTVCASLKKENALQRKQNSGKTGAKTLQHQLNLSAGKRDGHRQARLAEIAAMPEDSLPQSDAKEQAFQARLASGAVDPQVQAADLYCAAFFLSKTSGNRSGVPTTAHWCSCWRVKPSANRLQTTLLRQRAAWFLPLATAIRRSDGAGRL